MTEILNYILRLYKRLVSSIAFIPTIMIMISLVLGIAFFYFENTGYVNGISKYLDFALVHGGENARMILTTIIGGIISLTVFSFSMVMVVLNRASDSLSPRVLPQLVAQKFHQFVLGFYMGTIVYSLILIVNINPGTSVPSLGILLAMILAISALGLFIYFIHSISLSIQVDNIVKGIYQRTIKQINVIIEKQADNKEDMPEKFIEKKKTTIEAETSGYYQLVNLGGLEDFLSEHSIKLEISIFNGQFVTSGEVMVNFIEGEIDEDTKKTVRKYIYSGSEVEDSDEYYFGLRKISEIAVKALSPGINDPGTALKAIRLLTLLFIEVQKLKPYRVYSDESGEARVYSLLPTIELLLFENITPIRQYSAGSLEILQALFDFFHAMLGVGKVSSKNIMFHHLQALIDTSKSDLLNPEDLKTINWKINRINALPACSEHRFPLIQIHEKN